MTFNKQKFFIALICTAIGWGVGYQMGKNKAEEDFQRRNKGFGISQFLGMPFMHSFEDQDTPKEPSMWDRFFGRKNKEDNEPELDGSLHDNPFSLFAHRTGQPTINTREDDKFVYMEIELDSFDKNSLSARVENDTVVIEGNQKSEDQGNSMSSHFYQSVPAPAGTDPSKVDMAHENNKLVLKFPKLKN